MPKEASEPLELSAHAVLGALHALGAIHHGTGNDKNPGMAIFHAVAAGVDLFSMYSHYSNLTDQCNES